MLAAFTLPQSAIAQEQPFKADEAKILERVQSVEKQKPYPPDFDSAAQLCADHEMDRCFDSTLKEMGFSAARALCSDAELGVWQRLLKEAYEAAVSAQEEDDTLQSRSSIPSQPVLPFFVKAHKAWEAFIAAECALDRANLR